MNTTTDAASARRERLERWLREDPRNAALLADACDMALEAGDATRAQAHLLRARELALDAAPWTFRHARLALLRRDWDEAERRLREVEALAGPQPAVSHDLAFALWQRGEIAACRQALAPWVTAPPPDGAEAQGGRACQALWLRATHRLGLLQEAWDWLQAMLPRGCLHPQVQGVASLVALDRADFALARTLADAALASDGAHREALVARACVALAEQQAQAALELLRRALALKPDDGRTLSALGLALLQAGDVAEARSCLRDATNAMPQHIGTWHALGWCCLLQQDVAAALEAFQRALAIDANFAESHGAVALALMQSGRHEEAQRHLALADRLDRRNVTARYARALATGRIRDARSVRALAHELLDRPGFFGGSLGDSLPSAGD